jgi:hypothetical protein
MHIRIQPLLLCLLLFPFITVAQEEQWDVYLAQYEKGPGSIVLNMSLKEVAPMKTNPFILVTGVKFKDCLKDGMPTKNEFTNLYKVSDAVNKLLTHATKIIFAGTFTYQCERLDYFYIPDTVGIRDRLNKLYSKSFPNYESYISIKHDANWEAYLSFLFPNEEILNYMGDQKVVLQLQQAGDKLEKERQVDHWIYFDTDKDMECFIRYASANKFKIASKGRTEQGPQKYKLQIARTDKVDLGSINKITSELRSEATKCKGDYDGWETFVAK